MAAGDGPPLAEEFDDVQDYGRFGPRAASVKVGEKVLGRGAFCEVRLALLPCTTKLAALKRARRDSSESTHLVAMRDLRREAVVLAAMAPHRHIVKYLGWGEDAKNGFHVVLEHVPKPFSARFERWQQTAHKLPNEKAVRLAASKARWPFANSLRRWDALWAERLTAAAQLASALAHLHSANVVPGSPSTRLMFRDLKPSNMGFLGPDLILYDFGLARFVPAKKASTRAVPPTPETGSARFMAPEVAKGLRYDASCDVYSFGLILWHIASLKPVFHNLNDDAHYAAVVLKGHRPHVLARWHSDLKTLITTAWHHDPNKRPSAAHAELLLNNLASEYRDDASFDRLSDSS
eukprot:CAMPEP_0197387650 /NCGR_PEP_ID=MMETSP1165-20131217/648_1 /TAXON_ID=284809 /ORGANISM="Chrysocystis fragilis, Strain CCMP3189" /LENGTH=348 /DNA_ID=CAMNT_0042912983 /DNA_START=39 /DNA_END=1085 /DNA_ORIENTATION=-